MESDRALRFLQTLVQTPSLPGEEGEVARLVRAELETLGYPEVEVDAAGNVVARIPGRGEAPAALFNAHLDHVDPGDHDGWPEFGQPYSGAVHEGRLWGRGASDIKGPLVALIFGLARLIDGEPPASDIYLAATVQEELGGLGAIKLAERLRGVTPLAVVGEPSSNTLRRGHRGRTELIVHIEGRAVHASVPEQAINPHYVVARFLDRLQELPMAHDAELGPSSVAPTLIRTDQSSANVTPGELWLTLDYRNIPDESSVAARDRVQTVLAGVLPEGAKGEVSVHLRELESYTGATQWMEAGMPPFRTPSDHPAVTAAEAIIGAWSGRETRAGMWRFATDGGHFAAVGMTVIGFGPGTEAVIHTNREHIELDEWRAAMEAYALLARELPPRLV